MAIFAGFGMLALGLYLLILLVKAGLAWRYVRLHPEARIESATVTVLQPILSGDPLLERALRTNLESTTEAAQFLWLLDEDDAEAWRIANELVERFPGRVKLESCPPVEEGVNPKVVKLHQALPNVTTDFVAVLDDDTMLLDENLPKAVAMLESCDLYTGLPCYVADGNLWTSLVAHFVNNNAVLTYLPLLGFAKPLTINGMFYIMRTDRLRALGGFEPILRRLCDDYALARLARRGGCDIVQGITPQYLRTSISGPGHYFRLMHRWFLFANTLVTDQNLGVTLVLFLTLGLPPLLLWIGLASLAGGVLGAMAFIGALVVRHLVLRSLHRLVLKRLPHFSPAVSLLAELLQPIHWGHAMLQRVIVWRTRTIRPGKDGRFTYVGSDS
jgi:ceramide glucosyltransferase